MLPFISILAIIGLVACAAPPQSQSEEDRIKEEIAKANYCEVVSDCQQAAVSVCPFGCYIHVNKSEVSRIEKLLNEYQSTCMYSCVEFKGVDCVSNVCETRN